MRRFYVAVDGLRQISGLAWGDAAPQMTLIHGGAQNAHTFDTVALALQRPLLALDLPGHGHSDASPRGASAITSHARDVASALEQLAPGPRALVGMSLGGLVSLVVATERPDLVSSLTLIDITPGVNAQKAKHITDFINGPATFDNFDALLARTIEHNPTRSVSSLRRGILHNAIATERRHVGVATPATPRRRVRRARHRRTLGPDRRAHDARHAASRHGARVGRGQRGRGRITSSSPRRATSCESQNSGHSIQGDQPVVLAALLNRYAT